MIELTNGNHVTNSYDDTAKFLEDISKTIIFIGLFAERRRCFAVTCKTSWFPSALCCERAPKHALVAENRGDPASKYMGGDFSNIWSQDS